MKNKKLEQKCKDCKLLEEALESHNKELQKVYSELEEQARLNGMGAERELKLKLDLIIAIEVIKYIANSIPGPEQRMANENKTAAIVALKKLGLT